MQTWQLELRTETEDGEGDAEHAKFEVLRVLLAISRRPVGSVYVKLCWRFPKYVVILPTLIPHSAVDDGTGDLFYQEELDDSQSEDSFEASNRLLNSSPRRRHFPTPISSTCRAYS